MPFRSTSTGLIEIQLERMSLPIISSPVVLKHFLKLHYIFRMFSKKNSYPQFLLEIGENSKFL